MSVGDLVGRDEHGRFVSRRASRVEAPEPTPEPEPAARPEPAAEPAPAPEPEPVEARPAPAPVAGPRPLDPLLAERLAALPDAPSAPAPESEQPTRDPEPAPAADQADGRGPSAWLRPALWVAAGSLALVTVTLRVAGRGAPASAGPAHTVGPTGLEGGADEIHF